MSANYRSKLYHKSILLKPANTQLFEIFCHNNSVYSFLCWQSREITIRPTLKWLAKFKRGLTRFRTWSHTRWWWWCFCFFINFFFSWWECDTHMCSHVHSNPDLLSTATRRELLIRIADGSAIFENPMVEDRWAGSWLQYPSPACLHLAKPPSLQKLRQEKKMTKCQSRAGALTCPSMCPRGLL